MAALDKGGTEVIATDVTRDYARKSLYLGSAAALLDHGRYISRRQRRAEAALKRKAKTG